MARILKGTRIRGLPPKVLLSRRQDATGSFPTTWRTPSDNRTGKYTSFFNDDKVIPFNQKNEPEITYSNGEYTTPQYEEKEVLVLPKALSKAVVFDTPFTGIPAVVITELTSPNREENVNAFLVAVSNTGFTVQFSAPFRGNFVYRAVRDNPTGGLYYVERQPRYPNIYTTLVAGRASITSDYGFSISHDRFIPVNNYITFNDTFGNNQADIYPVSITSTATTLNVINSAFVPNTIKVNYLGVDDSATSPPVPFIDIKGLTYPLGMTSQAITASLSKPDILDLYKQPYLSGSEIKNLPIVTTGSMVRGISDEFVTFTPGQDIQPFKDFGNAAVDGKKTIADPFYATGSIPITFDSPLWSKSKIEFDLTPSTIQTKNVLKTSKFSNGPMFYWNNNTKLFDDFTSDSDGLQEGGSATQPFLEKVLDNYHIGFGYTMDDGTPEAGMTAPETYNVRGRQISNFGFPYNKKFDPTSEQAISMQDYISEPFLLEKIVLFVSSTLDMGTYPALTTTPTTFAAWTFFVLNQRDTYPQESFSQTISSSVNGTLTVFNTSSIIQNNIRDVVDYMQISVTNKITSNQYEIREYPVVRGATDRYITKQFVISSSLKSSVNFSDGIRSVYYDSTGGPGKTNYFVEKNEKSGRDGLNINLKNGRDFANIYDNSETIGTGSYQLAISLTKHFDIKQNYNIKPNPYILLPTDKIIFGWQLPLDMDGQSTSTGITFWKSGINKVIFYGSLMRVNEDNMLQEHHDTLNQLLISETIHEVITG